MISRELKELIEPKLKACLNRDTWDDIDYMFGECYRTNEDGFDMITLRPPKTTDLIGGFQFYEINGCFYGMRRMKEVRKEGTKL